MRVWIDIFCDFLYFGVTLRREKTKNYFYWYLEKNI